MKVMNKKADFKKIESIDSNLYDAVILSLPENLKIKYIKKFLKLKKHVLVEKPLISKKSKEISNIEKLSIQNSVYCYVAYDHRFENNMIKMKKILKKKTLGKIYVIKLFYGNGTAADIKKSTWRDTDSGVIRDLMPHLIDLLFYWFKNLNYKFVLWAKNKFENKSPDHAILSSKNPLIILETSYTCWKNDFKVDIFGSKGSAHIKSLSKWGVSKFIVRRRKFPSGVPIENKFIQKKQTNTIKEELRFFNSQVSKKIKTNLKKDIKINDILNKVS